MGWWHEGPDIKQMRKNAGFGPEAQVIFGEGVTAGIDWVRQEAEDRHDHEEHRSLTGRPAAYTQCQYTVCKYVKALTDGG